jgi:hypothetical protein
MAKTFVAHFTNKGALATGLAASTTFDVWEVASGTQVVTSGAATELGGGWYKHTYAAGDETLDYVALATSSTLNKYDKFRAGGSDEQGLTAEQAARLKYIWTHAAGDPSNKMTHTRAEVGTPGSASSDDNLVDQVVTQVDDDTATFEQQ